MPTRKSWGQAVSDPLQVAEEVLARYDAILDNIRCRMPVGHDDAPMHRLGLRYEGELLCIIATLRTIIDALLAVYEADDPEPPWSDGCLTMCSAIERCDCEKCIESLVHIAWRTRQAPRVVLEGSEK